VNPAPPWTWSCARRVVSSHDGPVLMGILNVTPDSFSDGGRLATAEAAVAAGLRLFDEGANIVDVGGESTRPGAEPVAEDEELRRVIPVVRGILRLRGDVVVSVDTMKATVAEAALAAGAAIINDVSGLTADPRMPAVARESGAGVVVMHMRGTPRTMQARPVYGNVAGEVASWLEERVHALEAGGIARERIAVDPGIGFGKTVEHNLELMARLDAVGRCGRPVVVGVSRKSVLGRLTGREVAARLPASLAALAFCVLNGAAIMRVHDVAASADALCVLRALLRAGKGAA
jgi:dihydropteroate synthase